MLNVVDALKKVGKVGFDVTNNKSKSVLYTQPNFMMTYSLKLSSETENLKS